MRSGGLRRSFHGYALHRCRIAGECGQGGALGMVPMLLMLIGLKMRFANQRRFNPSFDPSLGKVAGRSSVICGVPSGQAGVAWSQGLTIFAEGVERP